MSSEDGVETWERMRAVAQGLVDGVPHARAIGMRITDLQKGKAWGFAPFRDDLVGDPEAEVISGGVLIALLDNLCGVAAVAALDTPSMVATLDLRIDYMRPAAPRSDVFAVAQCHRVTRSVAFVRAVAYDHDEADPVAHATAAFMLRSPVRRSRKKSP